MANENLGASFSIDITNLKAGLNAANRLIRESESEFRAAAAGMDDWSKSADGLSARRKALNQQTDIQKAKIEALTKSKEETIKAMREQGKSEEEIARAIDDTNKQISKESKELDRLKGELNKTQKAIEDMGNESQDAGKSVEKAGKSIDEAGDSAKEAEKDFEGFGKAAELAGKAVAAATAAAASAVASFFALAESTRESRNAMALLDTSFQTADLSAADAEKTFNDLYGILGDEGRAVEAAQQLAKISKDEKDLAANTKILTGVMAEYGDSIPLEGLAEGIAASSSMSSVQGVLADALEWQGVNLDSFNEQLAALSTEEERSALIQKTLTGLYGDSADAYLENNEAVIEANKAQASLNDTLNDLGAIAEPIMTEVKKMGADALKGLTPFVELMGDGLMGALQGSDGATEKLSKGINGIVDAALNMIADMLPAVLEIVSGLIPSVISTLTAQLPKILQMLLSAATSVINSLVQILPQIVTTILGVIPQLLSALTAALPQIVDSIIAVVPLLITALTNSIPVLLQGAISFLMAIVQAVPTIVTELVAQAPTIVQNLVSALLLAMPILIEGAISLLMAILDALPVLIEALMVATPQIIDTLITGLIEGLPLLIDGAITLLMAIVEAFPIIIDAIIANLPSIISSLTSGLIKAIPLLLNAARELLFAILKAIPEIALELFSRMPEIWGAIIEGLLEGLSGIKEAGAELIRGLWSGISDMASWIGEKIKGFGESVLGGIKSFFGINSPSKVMADEVGTNLALGIGEGFMDSIGGVNKAIAGAVDVPKPQLHLGGLNAAGGLASGSAGRSVTVNQYNTYSQAHSRYELYQSQRQTEAALKLAMVGV